MMIPGARDEVRDFTPRSGTAILTISAVVGLAFAALTIELAYRASDGLTYGQQKALSDTYWGAEELQARSIVFKSERGRWPLSLDELVPEWHHHNPKLDGFGRSFRFGMDFDGPVFTSDGLDAEAGGEGLGADLDFRFGRDPARQFQMGGLRASRMHYLRHTAPDSLLSAFLAVAAIAASIVAVGLLSQRQRRRVDEPRKPISTPDLAAMILMYFLALITASVVVGGLMLGAHAYGGRH